MIDQHELQILTARCKEISEASLRLHIIQQGLAAQDEQDAKTLAIEVGEGIVQINGAVSKILGGVMKVIDEAVKKLPPNENMPTV